MDLRTLVQPGNTIVLTQECQRGIIGDLAQGVLPGASEEVGLVEKVGRLVKAGRDAGCRVLHCVAELRPDHPAAADNAPIMRAGKRGASSAAWDPKVMEIVDGIEVAESDFTSVRGVNVSPVIGTEVPTLLRNLGVTTVVAVGVSANLGIPHLALDCVNLGFNVVVPRDAIVGFPVDYVDVVVKNTLALVAKICTTEELVDAWSSS